MGNLEIIFENLWLSAWELRTCHGSQTNPVHKISQRIFCTLLHSLQCTVLDWAAFNALLHCCELLFVQSTGIKCSSLWLILALWTDGALHFAPDLHCVCTKFALFQICRLVESEYARINRNGRFGGKTCMWILRALIAVYYSGWDLRWVGGSSNIKIPLIWPFCADHSYSDSSK